MSKCPLVKALENKEVEENSSYFWCGSELTRFSSLEANTCTKAQLGFYQSWEVAKLES